MVTRMVQSQGAEWLQEGYRDRVQNGYKKGTEPGCRMVTRRVQRQGAEWLQEGYRDRVQNGYKKGAETGNILGA